MRGESREPFLLLSRTAAKRTHRAISTGFGNSGLAGPVNSVALLLRVSLNFGFLGLKRRLLSHSLSSGAGSPAPSTAQFLLLLLLYSSFHFNSPSGWILNSRILD